MRFLSTLTTLSIVILFTAAACKDDAKPDDPRLPPAHDTDGDGGNDSDGGDDSDGGNDSGDGNDSGGVLKSTRGSVLTSRNDNLRTGANLEEEILDPTSVKKLVVAARLLVDGELYAQPLVVPDVETPAGKKVLAIVATMNSSVYAFDLDAPDGTPPVWHVGAERELGVPDQSSRNVRGANGILSTPVIDRARGLVYAVARSCNADDKVTVGHCPAKSTVGRCKEILFALDLATGAVKTQTEVAGAVTNASGVEVPFDASVQWNRPALLLENDGLFVGFGSGPNANLHEEDFEYHGWMFRYDVADLGRPPAIYLTTPNGRGGSVWQAGAGPASDGKHVFFTGANRILPDCTTHPPADFPDRPSDADDSVIRVDVALAGSSGVRTNVEAKTYADARPYTAAGYSGTVVQFTNAGDCGFGSSGPTIIPDSGDLVVGSKGGLVYLLDRETMEPRQTPLSPFTHLPLQGDHSLYVHSWWGIPMIPGSFAFFRPDASAGTPAGHGLLYAWAIDDYLRSFRYDYASRTMVLERTGTVRGARGGYATITARGHDPASAIVWASSRDDGEGATKGHVWAFDATTLERLWDAATPAHSKFTPLTVARGRVLVPSALATGPKMVIVYGVPAP